MFLLYFLGSFYRIKTLRLSNYREMYNHQKIEKKWQKYWQEHGTFTTSNTSLKPKYYVLDMFPYPS